MKERLPKVELKALVPIRSSFFPNVKPVIPVAYPNAHSAIFVTLGISIVPVTPLLL